MSKLIFRNDDVSANMDALHLKSIIRAILNEYPDAEIWFGVTLFSKENNKGSIYPNPPFKNKPKQMFYMVDQCIDVNQLNNFRNIVKICSHGLWHLNHSKLGYELQEASIVTSCRYLDTDIFIPPFNQWNSDTQEICGKHGIELVKEDGWKNMEWNDFNEEHRLWYFHSWRWNFKEMKVKLSRTYNSNSELQ